MEFLQSFSLRDLLIFSPESYFKLFELSNKALWPFHIVLGLLAIAALVLLYKRQRFTSKLIFIWLGLVWTFVGYWYFGFYYSQINTYAHIISVAFWAEACLLFIYAFYANHESINTLVTSIPSTSLTPTKTSNKKWRLLMGGALIFYGLLVHPIVSLSIWNQTLSRLELFSIAPDPTAIATVGFILLLPVRGYLLLIAIPCLWLLFSIMTYQAF